MVNVIDEQFIPVKLGLMLINHNTFFYSGLKHKSMKTLHV